MLFLFMFFHFEFDFASIVIHQLCLRHLVIHEQIQVTIIHGLVFSLRLRHLSLLFYTMKGMQLYANLCNFN